LPDAKRYVRSELSSDEILDRAKPLFNAHDEEPEPEPTEADVIRDNQTMWDCETAGLCCPRWASSWVMP
jgi:hypothetical protein